MKAIRTNADKRRYQVNVDQHGRRWGFSVDKQTGDPVGGIKLLDVEDPLHTPQRFVRVDRNDARAMIVYWDEWIAEQKKADEMWRLNRNKIGMMHYRNAYNPRDMEDDPFLDELCGPKPFPSAKAITSARDGTPHMLGLLEEAPTIAGRAVDGKFIGKHQKVG